MRIINFLIVFFLIAFTAVGQESDFPSKSDKLVNDYAELLSPQEEAQLNRKLTNYHDTTSTEIAIVTITSLGAYDAMDYAIQLGENWGVGGSEFDNGILILIAENERKLAIATGYGLEGAIPDAATYTIREEHMQPYFSEGRFYEGLNRGTDIIIALAQGEYTAENIPGGDSGGGGGGAALIFILFFIIWTVFASRKANRYRKGAYGHRKMDFWTAFFLGSMMGGRSGRTWSDFSGGGGSFGGGGGGFGGFGGGSFGGGGSAGSW